MTGKERVTESGKGTSVLTLILSYPQNRDAKDWAAGNGRLSYLLMLLLLCLRVCVEHSLLLELAKYAIFSKTKPQNKILTNEAEGIANTTTQCSTTSRCGVHFYVSNESQGDDVLAI